MRVLVTGASGFVGRHVVPRLARDHQVLALQRRAGNVPDTPAVSVLALDLEGLTVDGLATAVGGPIDAIVHLAARLDNPFGVDFSVTELAAVNVVGTLRLLDAASHLGVRRFVYGSTGGVARNPAPGELMSENDPPGPVNPYGLTKHLAEQAVLTYDWPFQRVSLRYFAPYGRDGSNPMFRHFLGRLERGEPIDLPDDGGAMLNPIHVDDAAEATVRSLSVADPPRIVNVAGPDIVSLRNLVGLLSDAVGRPAVLRQVAGPGLNWAADISLMSRVLGPPAIRLPAGIAREFGPATGRVPV